MLSPCPAVRRGAHCAPAGCRAAVIRYHPPAVPVLSPSVGAGPRPARRCISGNGVLGMFRPRASDFLCGQKVTKEPSKGRGISISLSPLKSSLLKTTNQGGCGPPIGCTPREGRTPRRFSYWLIGLVPLFRRGAHRAPAGCRATVIRRGGYYPPAIPVYLPP